VVVRLRDAHGNALTSSGGEVTLTTTFGNLSLVTDHDDGTYTASLTASATGRATVAFAIDGEAGSAVAEVLAAQRLPTTGPLLAGTVLTALGLLVAGMLVRLRRART
jgi:adhesin/invasin